MRVDPAGPGVERISIQKAKCPGVPWRDLRFQSTRTKCTRASYSGAYLIRLSLIYRQPVIMGFRPRLATFLTCKIAFLSCAVGLYSC